MSQTICTYGGDYHCDQIFACYLLKQILAVQPKIIRTQDTDIIKRCDIAVGVGSVYDHRKFRYDHHSRDFDLSLNSLDDKKPFKTKLSCAGLVYYHYGRQVIAELLDMTDDYFKDEVEALFDVIYENFVQEIDGFANGITFYDERTRFKIGTDLTSRINRFRWNNEKETDLSLQFDQAMVIVEQEFEETLKYYGNIWLPALLIVRKAMSIRKEIHPSGEIIDLGESGPMPWLEHLIAYEKEKKIEGQIKFAILYEKSGIWRLSCVPLENSLDEPRIPFHSHWHGLSRKELNTVTGVSGCLSIHPKIGDFETKEASIAIADKLIQLNATKHLNLNKSNSLSDGSFYSLTENLSIDEKIDQAHENGGTQSEQVSGSSFNNIHLIDTWVEKNGNMGIEEGENENGAEIGVEINENEIGDEDVNNNVNDTVNENNQPYFVDNQGSCPVNQIGEDGGDSAQVESDECEEMPGIIDPRDYINEDEFGVESHETDVVGAISHLITILENGCQLYSIPPPSLPLAEYHFCVVSALVDPSEFYIHLSNDDSSQLDDIQEQLSNHFAVNQNDDLELPEDPSLLIDSCWAAIYPTDNEWCRVKVIDLVHSEDSQDCLLPIDLINIPAYAVRCRLSHISPPPEGWTIECMRYFEELTGIKIEQMVTVYVTERPTKNNYEEPLSVFLWYSDSALGQGKDILVNAALVKASFAQTDSMDWVIEADAQSKEKTPPEISIDKISVPTCSQSKPVDLHLHVGAFLND